MLKGHCCKSNLWAPWIATCDFSPLQKHCLEWTDPFQSKPLGLSTQIAGGFVNCFNQITVLEIVL